MCNLNVFGQIFRMLFGAILIASAWYGPQTDYLPLELMNLWNLGWLGIVPLASGFLAFCPIYAVLGIGHKHGHKHGHDSARKPDSGHSD